MSLSKFCCQAISESTVLNLILQIRKTCGFLVKIVTQTLPLAKSELSYSTKTNGCYIQLNIISRLLLLMIKIITLIYIL